MMPAKINSGVRRASPNSSSRSARISPRSNAKTRADRIRIERAREKAKDQAKILTRTEMSVTGSLERVVKSVSSYDTGSAGPNAAKPLINRSAKRRIRPSRK